MIRTDPSSVSSTLSSISRNIWCPKRAPSSRICSRNSDGSVFSRFAAAENSIPRPEQSLKTEVPLSDIPSSSLAVNNADMSLVSPAVGCLGYNLLSVDTVHPVGITYNSATAVDSSGNVWVADAAFATGRLLPGSICRSVAQIPELRRARD